MSDNGNWSCFVLVLNSIVGRKEEAECVYRYNLGKIEVISDEIDIISVLIARASRNRDNNYRLGFVALAINAEVGILAIMEAKASLVSDLRFVESNLAKYDLTIAQLEGELYNGMIEYGLGDKIQEIRLSDDPIEAAKQLI